MKDMMEKRVLRYIQEHDMVQPGDRVAVALSGGADSVCLLHIFTALAPVLKIRVSAVHVHHGLRDTADRDEQFVRELCRKLQTELTVFHVHVPEEARAHHTGIEETARRLRYEALESLEVERLALAHHSQDQAETLLLNLLRGSGLRGLAGMPPVYGRRIRPLLEETPEAIRAYLRQHDSCWMEDETNQDPTYRRNRLRHEILPMLSREFNPRLVTALAKTTELLQEDEAVLTELTREVLVRCEDGGGLRVSELAREPAALQKRCLRLYLQQTMGLTDLSQSHMEAVMELFNRQSGRRTVLPGGFEVVREYDRLYVRKRLPQRPLEENVWEVPEPPCHVSIEIFSLKMDFSFVKNMEIDTFSENLCTKSFDYDTIKNTLKIRTRRPGDYLTMAGGHKKLKNFMIDAKIPAEERDKVLLLADGAHILWVMGYRMSDACKVRPDTKRILQVSCRRA